MAYDNVLVERVRDHAPPDMVEKNVFGARCWVLDGNMAFGVHDEDLLVRLGADPEPDTSRLTGFDPMGSGKPMAGWFIVSGEDVAEDPELMEWIGYAWSFTRKLPPK